MKDDDRFNLYSQFELSYFPLNSVPATMSPIEAECLDMPADTTKHTQTSEKGIIVGLGLIATLLLLSGIQLHNSVNKTAIDPGISKAQKLSIFNTKQYFTHRFTRKLNRPQSQQTRDFSTDAIKILTIKNAIAQGQF